jgi:L,D-transpeptidase YcbB
VKRFQIRHGLDPDGVIGKSTAAALQVPLSWRVWAWDLLPPNGAPLVGMNAIVGRALRTPTPVLIGEIDEVIFRPFWNVPRSILLGEVLPKIERDPDYLRREDMEIVRSVDGDGSPRLGVTSATLAGLRSGALRVRQRPGPKNALGLIKFEFPNKEGVYLHGTPAQALFAKSRRDFSHGCVRVADPVALAEWVLRDRAEWTRDQILAATAGPQTLRVKVPRPITVIFFYMTAAVMPDGTMRFAADIYRHDARLDRALAMRLPLPDATGVDVHEVGRGIVADAAASHVERRPPQRGQRHVTHPDVDRLALHVQAARRHAFAAVPKPVVGRRRPVA